MERKIVLSEQEIAEICMRIAAQLDERFAKNPDKIPVIIGVLKGSLNFMMDLLKYIKTPVKVDYIQCSSYQGTRSTGAVVIKKDLSSNVKDKTIVIVEDVIDTGFTMKYLIDYFNEKYQPSEIIICSLFDKLHLRQTNVSVDYIGRSLSDDMFLLGYGLDYNELFRNYPYVFAATEEDIKKANELLDKNK